MAEPDGRRCREHGSECEAWKDLPRGAKVTKVAMAGLGNTAPLELRTERHLPDEPYNNELQLTRSARRESIARRPRS